MRHVRILGTVGMLLVVGCQQVPGASMARQMAPAPQVRTASFAEHKRAMILVADQFVKGCDRDGDGQLSLSEARAADIGPDAFAKADTNHDGKLNLAEILAATDFKGTYKWFKGRAGELFQQMDRNHDGNVSFDEFSSGYYMDTPAQKAIPFGLGDRNRDGKLTYAEYENALAWMFARGALDYLPSPAPVTPSAYPTATPSPLPQPRAIP